MATPLPPENGVPLLLATSLPHAESMVQRWYEAREKWAGSALNLEEHKAVLITETNQNLELLQNCFHHPVAVESN